jgi:hypothetical protein
VWTNAFPITARNNPRKYMQRQRHRHQPPQLIRTATTEPSIKDGDDTSYSGMTVNNTHEITNLPHHIALVCDGNTRWAKQHHQPTIMGHFVGANRTIELIQALRQRRPPPSQLSSSFSNQTHSSVSYDEITHLTFYAFSTENWNRPSHEIENLFRIVEQTANYWYRILQQEDKEEYQYQQQQQQQQQPKPKSPHPYRRLVIKFIGNLDDPRIPHSLRTSLIQLQAHTLRTPPYSPTSFPLPPP